MKMKCLKCNDIKDLSVDELKEVGEFIESRKLRGVAFLKYVSMDLRNPCKDGKEHQYEFEEEFDKEVHLVAKNINDADKKIWDCEKEINDCDTKIAELIVKKEEVIKIKEIQREILNGGKDKLKEIAWIPDPRLWS